MGSMFDGVSDGIALLPDAWGLAAWLADGTLKWLVLLTIAWGAALVLRRRSAATVHRVWSICFAGCLVVPVMSVVAPQWSLRIVPTFPQMIAPATVPASPEHNFAGTAAAPQFPLPGAVDRVVTPPLATAKSGQVASPVAPVIEAAVAAPSPAISATGAAPSAGESTVSGAAWVRTALMCWAVATVAIASRMALHYVVLRRILRNCTMLSDTSWAEAVAAASRRMGLARQVRLLQSESQLSPLAAGMLQPTVVLPAGASDWSDAQRQSVLLHEFAHVKRHDVLTQFMAGCVCTIIWFNPLCWYGLSQMRKLRELACDDLVLAGGQAPTDYAAILLDVARSYRHRSLVGAVGMARASSVERRIVAILDSARNRMPLSRRGAIGLLGGAVLLVALLGSTRFENRAAKAEESTGTDQAADKGAQEEDRGDVARQNETERRTLEVLVTDEEGSPLPGSQIYVSALGGPVANGKRENLKGSHPVDERGVAQIPLPARVTLLRMWASSAGRVPEFINFGKGEYTDAIVLPSRVNFRLAEGTTLSGRVVDVDGAPISGAHVDVQVEVKDPSGPSQGYPVVSNWLTDAFNEPEAITDAEGKWSIKNAPALLNGEDHQFDLKILHDDYVSDSNWGGLQRAQGVTAAMLRDGSAKIALSRGKPVTGRIVNSDGKPVTKGLVIWSDNTYFAEGVNEAQIQSDGRFETIPLPPREYPITVAAPGFQPEQRLVKVGPDLEPLEFKLKPGKRLAIRLVGHEGQGISKAYIGVGPWRGTEALYNEDHPNVPDSGISRRPDETGLYVWDWAPEDAVTFNISSIGFAATKVSLVARDEEHVVTLSPQLTFSGTVTDAATGGPIPKFRVIPVVVFRKDFYSVSFQDSVSGKDGRYEIPIRTYEPSYRYVMRVEAEGYRSAMSETTYGERDGAVVQDFKLEPAAAREGVVLGPDGAPVAGAAVIAGTPSVVPMLSSGEVGFGDRGEELKTAADGRFALAATWEPMRIRATHALGFAEVLRSPEEEIGPLTLVPWAKASGRLVQDGRPMKQQGIIVTTLPERHLGEARFQDSYQTQTDSDGRFEFKRLPPGPCQLRVSLGPWRESELTSGASLAMDLKPGESRELLLGGAGAKLSGKVVATGRGNAPLDRNWSLNYLVSRDRGVTLPERIPLGFEPKGPIQSSWLRDARFSDWVATRDNYFVKLASDGEMQIHGVPAGQYDLVLQLYEQPAGCLVQTVGERVVPTEVTEADVAAGSKSVGEIEVACRVGPRVGENMQAYKFVDAEGHERTVYDMQGRYLLMHVWASECELCLAVMPEITAMVEEQGAAPVTFVGLNVDTDKDAGRALAKRAGWTWSQNYLGKDSEMSKQLALSTTPSYFLIGPDGLLIASSAEWSEVRAALTKALQEAR
jgi:beta-lactamase regulating signal transducer with metallopeptidase domain/thiol-disulfide isomerase/thioredoxin